MYLNPSSSCLYAKQQLLYLMVPEGYVAIHFFLRSKFLAVNDLCEIGTGFELQKTKKASNVVTGFFMD